MISYLKGEILKTTDKGIILNTGNIGYFVHTKKTFLDKAKKKQEIEFFIHSNIREDSFDLYGFSKYEELTFFTQLISISGIGPKVGIEILDNNLDEVKSAIVNENAGFLSQIPGIGKKTAQRIILELKNKISEDNIGNISLPMIDAEAENDILEALTKLGYQRSQIRRRLRDLPEGIKEAEAIISYFLKHN